MAGPLKGGGEGRVKMLKCYIHTYMHTYIHKYINTYIHTYIHKYIHTYINTDPLTKWVVEELSLLKKLLVL